MDNLHCSEERTPKGSCVENQQDNSLLLPGEPILSALVGSQAYGTANEDSDRDYLGVYLANTEHLLGLSPVEQTVRRVKPDMTFYELGKFLRLAMACNPTILELLWCEEHHHCDSYGVALLGVRSYFLSKLVRRTYLGYARSQLRKMEKGKDSKLYAKHARHTMRLLQQGYELLTTGNLTLRVADPDELRALSELPFEEFKDRAEEKASTLLAAECVLPNAPNSLMIDLFLRRVRREQFWVGEPMTIQRVRVEPW